MTIMTLSREQAHEKYGEAFVRFLMKGKQEIQIGPKQRILLEKWKLIRKKQFAPYAYEYVYIVADETSGAFKIGMTRAPRSRLSALRNGSTNDLRIVGLIVVGGQDGRNLERFILSEYKRKGRHVRGEWFSGDATKEMPIIRDLALTYYGSSVVSLSDAYEGCEPLVDLYIAANGNSPATIDMIKCRADFLWVVERADKNHLTVLS